jgi:hypothetical protein
MAGSTGNSSQVGPADSTEMGNGQVNNANNPHAAGVLDDALGVTVFHNLADALQDIGDWADAGASVPVGINPGGEETILSGGDVVEITDKKVKSIPPNQAPPQLQKALQGFNH